MFCYHSDLEKNKMLIIKKNNNYSETCIKRTPASARTKPCSKKNHRVPKGSYLGNLGAQLLQAFIK